MIAYEEMLEYMMSLGFKRTEKFSGYCGFRKDPFYVMITSITHYTDPIKSVYLWEFSATMNVAKDGWHIENNLLDSFIGTRDGVTWIKRITRDRPPVTDEPVTPASEIMDVAHALSDPYNYMTAILHVEWASELVEAWLRRK